LPLLLLLALEIVSEEAVCPARGPQIPVLLSNCHWYVNGGVPAAVTVNEAFPPVTTEALTGDVVVVPAFTVSTALREVTDGPHPLTITV